LGGSAAWRTWTQSLAGLQIQEVAACGAELWELLHAIAVGVTTPLLWELAVPFADLFSRCSHAFAKQNHLCRVMLSASTAIAEGVCGQKRALQCQTALVQKVLVQSVQASCGLLVANPSLLSCEGGRAPEAWLRAALQVDSGQHEASGISQQLLAMCSEVLDAAQTKAQAPLLNLGWKLLKQLAVFPECDPAAAVHILLAAGRDCGKQLQELEASMFSDQKRVPGDTVHLAMFHGSNVLRLLRDAAALKKAPSLWLSQLLKNLAAGGSKELLLDGHIAVNATLAKARELLEKMSKAILEQIPKCSRPLKLASALLQFLSTHWMALACDGAVGEATRLMSMSVCGAVEEELGAQSVELGLDDADLDAIARLCAAGAPEFRPHLLVWTLSTTPALYCVAVKVHVRMPLLQGLDSNLEWLQTLLDMLTCSGQVGQEEHQVASCLACMLHACPWHEVSPWMESTLLPPCMQHPGPGLKVLMRKLGMACNTGEIAAPVAGNFVANASSTKHGILGQDFASEASLRTLAALTSVVLDDQDPCLRDLQERLQAVMDRATIPLELRLAAWEAHAAICFRTTSVSSFNTSLRYAMKHLSRSRSAGVRVANVMAKAPPSMIREGAAVILQALCEMQWPLRSAGLTTAASLQAAGEVTSLQAETAAVAAAAVLAFNKSLRHQGNEEDPQDEPLERKRRKLLESLVELPHHIDGGGREDMARLQTLCTSALHRLQGWMPAPVGF